MQQCKGVFVFEDWKKMVTAIYKIYSKKNYLCKQLKSTEMKNFSQSSETVIYGMQQTMTFFLKKTKDVSLQRKPLQ